MKLTKIMNLLVLGSALTITAVGCKNHKPQNATPLPGQASHIPDQPPINPQPPLNPISDVDSRNIANRSIVPNGPMHPGWVEDPASLARATVYFDYDKSAIKGSEQAKLEDVANYLKGNPQAAVRVEGNCDERGTEEYNRALGERRALSAREYLVSLGIEASRVDTLTKGEDNPADPGHNEQAWKKNRRDEFVVLLPPKM